MNVKWISRQFNATVQYDCSNETEGLIPISDVECPLRQRFEEEEESWSRGWNRFESAVKLQEEGFGENRARHRDTCSRSHTRARTYNLHVDWGFENLAIRENRRDGAKTRSTPEVELPSKLSWPREVGPFESILLAGLNRETIGALADLFQLLFLMNLI